jgi:hypothetical protein
MDSYDEMVTRYWDLALWIEEDDIAGVKSPAYYTWKAELEELSLAMRADTSLPF